MFESVRVANDVFDIDAETAVEAPRDCRCELAQAYEVHAPALLRYAMSVARNRDLAADAVQESLFRYYICLRAGVTVDSPRAWLVKVVRNYIIDDLRRTSRCELGLEHLAETAANAPDRERELDSKRISEDARSLLSDREFECVQLRAQGLRYEEIGSAMSVERGTVSALLARATRKLKRALSPKAAPAGRRAL